ncbi:MAG: ABC transporter ATP-binding protein [Anaerolineaceae bacterium]|nr:ABC transporter ATP-binding protein [Anaerolineaceae bacterium]
MSETPTYLIETINLTRIYGDGHGIRALDGVNLKIAPGELVAVMGPSGSGKSTLLNVIGALDKPDQGKVIINGRDLATIKDKDAFRSKTVGFVFQLHNLLPTLTARENVEIPMMGSQSLSERRRRSQELLGLVGLADRMGHLPGQLSGGERQRVAIARALANNPPLVLADEPTGALDTASSQELMLLLKTLNRTYGTTIVVVTHDPAIARQTRRVVLMQDGKIVQEDFIGSPLEEDLKMWLRTGLGKRVLEGDIAALRDLGLDLNASQADAVCTLLRQAEDNENHKTN